MTVRDRVASWRFKHLGASWPFVQIVSPADVRMVTRPAGPRQVPRPGSVAITAKVFGATGEPVTFSVRGDAPRSMMPVPGAPLWRAPVELDAGLHDIVVTAGGDHDAIRVLVRDVDDIPKRNVPLAPGCDIHAVGARTEHGLEGTQLGPNKNAGLP